MVFTSVKFNLDVSGIAGFFGGDESIAAMASVNLVRFNWLLGWYNSPGSYFVSKKYGIIAGTRIWDGLFPGKGSVPAEILGLDGMSGPRFLGAKSGTTFATTGHLAHLLSSHCHSITPASPTAHSDVDVPTFNSLTLVQLPENGHPPSPAKGDQPPLAGSPAVRDYDMNEHIMRMPFWGILFALLTIAFSIVAAIVAAVEWQDFACLTAIAIGIAANGFATLVYGSATLTLETPITLKNAVAGDGVFVHGNHMIILEGPESKIATITRGRYKLTYKDKPSYHLIGCVSMGLVTQALSQLILLPLATLKGQGIFLATFALSWLYNAHLASVDREKLQFEALNKMLHFRAAEKRTFRTWASAVAASAFRLHPIRPDAWLRQLIPNETPVWNKWRDIVANAVKTDTVIADAIKADAENADTVIDNAIRTGVIEKDDVKMDSKEGINIYSLSENVFEPDSCQGWNQDERDRLESHLKDALNGYRQYGYLKSMFDFELIMGPEGQSNYQKCGTINMVNEGCSTLQGPLQ